MLSGTASEPVEKPNREASKLKAKYKSVKGIVGTVGFRCQGFILGMHALKCGYTVVHCP